MPGKKREIRNTNETWKQEDKFAVAVIGGNHSIVGHLMEGKNGKFANTILFFLRGVHMIDVTLVLPVKELIREMVKVLKYHVYRNLQDSQIIEILIKELKKV